MPSRARFALCALEASLTALAPGVAGASLPAPLKTAGGGGRRGAGGGGAMPEIQPVRFHRRTGHLGFVFVEEKFVDLLQGESLGVP